MDRQYLSEFKLNRRPLIAASLGFATGYSFNNIINGTLAPYFLKDLGWSKAQLASVFAVMALSLIATPVVGRMNDIFGVRRTAAVGVFVFPLTLLALSMMTGSIWQFYTISAVQAAICICGTNTVYSRLVAERFTLARGVALALFASAPPVLGFIVSPLLNAFAHDHGWRDAYQLVALCSFAAGVTALALMPRSRDQKTARTSTARRGAREDYARVLGRRVFWIIVAALLLCNIPQVIYLQQLNLMLIDKGASVAIAAGMVSIFSLGNIIGRFICGVALDRFPMHLVAAISMSVPCIGFFLLASDLNGLATLYVAVLLLGFAYGAEGDLLGYMTVHLFGIEVYSSALSLMTTTIVLSITIGSQVLAFTLRETGNFSLFLSICGVCVMVGGLLLLFIGRGKPVAGSVTYLEPRPEPA